MLGIRCSQRHALPHITPIKCTDRELRSPPARAGSFFHPFEPFAFNGEIDRSRPIADTRAGFRTS